MNSATSIRALFLVAAAYDGLLGLAFLFAGQRIFAALGITPPNHWGYVDFGAGILVLFGILFLQVAKDPGKYCLLIPYGILLKVCYVATVAGHWCFGEGLPNLWKVFAAADTLFAILFYLSLRALRPTASSG